MDIQSRPLDTLLIDLRSNKRRQRTKLSGKQPPASSWPQRLRLLRTLRGWSQETLAEQAGLHRTYISGIERAERNLGLDNLDKLAQAFGVTVGELLMANPMTQADPLKIAER